MTIFAAASLTDAFTEIGQSYHAQHSNIMSDLARPEIKLVIETKDTPCGEYTLQMLGKMTNDTTY